MPFETVAIAIPFYLARPELTALHEEQTGHVEGFNRADILRYLRHEMGHVVSYAYRLYDDEEWVRRFGSITQPYEEDYPSGAVQPPLRPAPSGLVRAEASRRRLGGNLRGVDDAGVRLAARSTRAGRMRWGSSAIATGSCRQLTARDPLVTTEELDEDVAEIGYSVADYYEDLGLERSPDFPPGTRRGAPGHLRGVRRGEPRRTADVPPPICWPGSSGR